MNTGILSFFLSYWNFTKKLTCFCGIALWISLSPSVYTPLLLGTYTSCPEIEQVTLDTLRSGDTYANQSAGTFFEDNSGENMDEEHKNTLSVHSIEKNSMETRKSNPDPLSQ